MSWRAWLLRRETAFTALLVVAVAEFFGAPRVRALGAYVRPVDLLALAAAALLAWQWLGAEANETSQFFRRRRPLLLLTAGLLAAGVLTELASFDHARTLVKLVQLCERLSLVWLAAWSVRGRAAVSRLTATIVLAAVAEAVIGFAQYALDLGRFNIGQMTRMTGTLGNSLGGYLLLGFALSLVLALDEEQAGSRWPWRGAAVVLAAALLLVQVKTLWLLLPAVLLFAAVLGGDALRWKPALLGLLVAAPLFWGVNLAHDWARPAAAGAPSSAERFVVSLSGRGLKTARVRLELWLAASRMFRYRPLTGVGLGNFGRLYLSEPYTSPALRELAAAPDIRLSDEIDAHSGFFTRLAETGLAGTAATALFWLFLLALAIAVAGTPGCAPAGIAVAVAVAASLAADLIADPLGGNLFWLLAGTLATLAAESGEGRETGRVIVVTGSRPPMRCGVGDYTHSLVEEMRGAGIPVSVYSSAGSGPAEPGFRPVASWSALAMIAVSRSICAEEPSLVHLQYPTIGYGYQLGPQALIVLLRAANVRVVTTVHEFQWAHPLRRLSLLPLLYLSNGLIFTSEEERASVAASVPWLRAKLQHASIVTPVGSNIPVVEREDADTCEVAFFGLFYPGRQLESVIAAFELAARQEPRMRFRFIGDLDARHRDYYASIRRMADERLPRERVSWSLGREPEEVARLLAGAQACLLPFPDGASFRRTSLLAALSQGTPVVTTRGPSTSAMIRDGLHVLFARDPRAMAEQLVAVCNDPALAERLSENGQRLAEGFSWDRILRDHLALYARVWRTPVAVGASEPARESSAAPAA